MRSKKGFTLIELLAVIVILAIIALIAVPIILNMINDARKAAAVDSAYGYIEAIEYQNSMNMLDNKKYKKITDGENLDVISIDSLVKVKGTRPDSGTITIEKGRVKEADLCIDGFNIIYDGKKASATASKKCGSGSDVVEEVIIEDEKPCELKEEAIDDKEYLYIDSVEDMYAFSKSVNNGNSYQGKIVKLRNNLDFSTYKPEEKASVCGISNEKGFISIGTDTKPFIGTFDGGGKIISNLTINKSNQNYVGLFGVVKGTESEKTNIYGIRMVNEVDEDGNSQGSIKGVSFTGSLVGYVNSYTTIRDIELDNVDVIGSGYRPQYVGGLVGYIVDSDTITINNILIKNEKVSGWDNVGYLSGGNYHRITNSIIEKLSFNMTAVGNSSKTSSSYNTYHSNLCTANGFDSKGIDDINFYEAAGLDTWIGGDDDKSGYYFDYDKDGKVILKSIKQAPITFNLSKDSNGNYLIKTEKDWKQASIKNNENYKLEANLDFSTNKYYMLGSNKNKFSGTLDGNDKIVKNITINGNQVNFLGMIGFVNSGTIHGITVKNIEVNGYGNVGLIGQVIGTSDEKRSNIYGIRIINKKEGENNFKGGFTGNNVVGSLVGHANSYTTIKEIELDNINVIGNGDRPQHIGGAIGYVTDNDTMSISNILIKNALVSGWNVVGYLSGGGYNRITNSIVEKLAFNMTAVGTLYKTSSSYNTYHSNLCTTNNSIESNGYDSKGIDDVNFYEAAGLDTWIGGDDDESGYYFDYDDNNKIVLKSTKKYPLTFNLNKDSKGNYLVKNEKDWKVASLKNNENYKLESDLDFSKNKYYMLGSNKNKFSGTLDGNDKTVKNITINGNRTNFLGMIGFVNSGTIHGITVKNIEVNGYGNVGLIGQVIGTSDEKRSNIYGIRIINKKEGENNFKGGFTGNNVVGSLVGHANSYTTIKEIEIDNVNVIGNGDRPQHIGGAIGYVTDNDTMSVSNILIKNASVSGWNYVGYLSGGGYNRITNSIVENLSFNMTAVGTSYKTSSSYNTYRSNLCTTNGSIESVGFDSSLIGDLDYYAGKLETLYDGDKNGTGYFYDYVEDSNGIQLVKAYTPKETETPTEKPNCTIIKGSQERGCYLYTSGVHGNYLYEGVSASDTGAGATCSSTPGRVPAYRYKIKYNCS